MTTKECRGSGSPTGSPVEMATTLEFAARHSATPQTEHFPMCRINEVHQRLESGKAREVPNRAWHRFLISKMTPMTRE
jgi:D-arabinose 1-dehydrogenase-like Zn-dependent alcohol dehydrogenase